MLARMFRQHSGGSAAIDTHACQRDFATSIRYDTYLQRQLSGDDSLLEPFTLDELDAFPL